MCTTCGCGQPDDPFTIQLMGSEKKEAGNSDHHHDHSHGDGHHHHDHEHDHDHHHHHHPERSIIELEADVLGKNNLLAERNRGFFEAKNILALNLVSSPGSGKTSLLEKTIQMVDGTIPMSVVEGDQQTANDAERIHKTGVKAVQVNTGKGCHLDALMVNKAMKQLELEENGVMFIENVGNLVCPAMFDLGESKRVVIVSVTEGADKPLKYPDMFESSQVCMINKTDLLPYVDFDVNKFREYAMRINHHLEFIEVSATKGDGMENWISWIKDQLESK